MGYPAIWKKLFGNSDKLQQDLLPFGNTTPKANSGTGSAGTSKEPARADHIHPAQTSLSGNAATASKLQTARTIKLTGDATGSGSFDGSKDLSITTTVATMKAATADTAGAKGLVPAPAGGAQGKYLRGDGTWQTPTNTDTKVTQTVTTTNDDFPVLTTALADATANRTEGVRFDTKVKVNHSTGNLTAPTFTGNLKGNVTGNVSGSSGSCTGNAATATKLATKRSINGMQFDSSGNIFNYGTCSTAAGTAAKTVKLDGFVLATGATIRVRFSNANTASNATLNVNATGAKAIRYKNAAIPANLIEDEGTYEFVYDGTAYQLIGGGSSLATIDPWDIFPMYVPINVFGVKFGGSDGRRAIMPGESTARENWVICDGGSDGKGGTVPDLRGRFIMGASDEYKAGSTGGSKTHSHTVSGTVGATTITEDQLATHHHATERGSGYFIVSGGDGEANAGGGWGHTFATSTNDIGDSQSHTHNFTGTTATGNNLPTYYSLTYVMRVA